VRVHPRIREALEVHRAVCVETTGASAEILIDLPDTAIVEAFATALARSAPPVARVTVRHRELEDAFDFVSAGRPLENEAYLVPKVEDIFRRRGAYGRFKSLLERRGVLDEWYAYEARHRESALRQWCAENGIALVD